MLHQRLPLLVTKTGFLFTLFGHNWDTNDKFFEIIYNKFTRCFELKLSIRLPMANLVKINIAVFYTRLTTRLFSTFFVTFKQVFNSSVMANMQRVWTTHSPNLNTSPSESSHAVCIQNYIFECCFYWPFYYLSTCWLTARNTL